MEWDDFISCYAEKFQCTAQLLFFLAKCVGNSLEVSMLGIVRGDLVYKVEKLTDHPFVSGFMVLLASLPRKPALPW